MNFQIASDIHIEKLYPSTPKIIDFITPVDGVETLILAGDIGSAYHVEPLKSFFVSCREHFENVIFVPGNNEYYERAGFTPKLFPELEQDLKDLCKECGVIFLNNSYIETDTTIIFGSTWWSHIPDALTMKIYKREGVILDSDDFNHMHNASRRCLNRMIEMKGDKKLIVITHYCPTRFGTMNLHHRKPDFESLVPYYFSASEKFLRSGMINAWIFGHTHVFRDFFFENTSTRIISNADPRKRIFRRNFVLNFENEILTQPDDKVKEKDDRQSCDRNVEGNA